MLQRELSLVVGQQQWQSLVDTWLIRNVRRSPSQPATNKQPFKCNLNEHVPLPPPLLFNPTFGKTTNCARLPCISAKFNFSHGDLLESTSILTLIKFRATAAITHTHIDIQV